MRLENKIGNKKWWTWKLVMGIVKISNEKYCNGQWTWPFWATIEIPIIQCLSYYYWYSKVQFLLMFWNMDILASTPTVKTCTKLLIITSATIWHWVLLIKWGYRRNSKFSPLVLERSHWQDVSFPCNTTMVLEKQTSENYLTGIPKCVWWMHLTVCRHNIPVYYAA